MKKLKKHLTALLFAAVFISASIHPQGVSAEKEYSSFGIAPTVCAEEITTQTTKVRVYVFADTTLEVRNKSKTIFKKTYDTEGKKTITIPKQKAGTELCFAATLKNGKKASTVATVEDADTISSKKPHASLKKPKIKGNITDKTTSVKVYAKKGETLYIQNGSKTVKKVTYKKTGYKKISFKKQKAETRLTFYTADRKGRSAYVTKKVKDVTPPSKPKVLLYPKSTDIYYGLIEIEGEEYTDVYIRHNSSGKAGEWKYLGTLGTYVEDIIAFPYELFRVDRLTGITSVSAGDTFSVRLVDDAGNTSKTVTTKPIQSFSNAGR